MGGGNVSANVTANHIIYNDNLWQISKLLETFSCIKLDEILKQIDTYITDFNLTKENKEGYLQLRDSYNKLQDKTTHEASILLYTMICFSFNNQIRFNSNGEYNMPFGKRSFNPELCNKLKVFVKRLQRINISFNEKCFRKFDIHKLGINDFVYCDPPYLISGASYNENKGWNESDEYDLLNILDEINTMGCRFALSNVFESKGKSNDILKTWSNRYNIHYLKKSYSNCSYNKKDRDSKDIEVLITNY